MLPSSSPRTITERWLMCSRTPISQIRREDLRPGAISQRSCSGQGMTTAHLVIGHGRFSPMRASGILFVWPVNQASLGTDSENGFATRYTTTEASAARTRMRIGKNVGHWRIKIGSLVSCLKSAHEVISLIWSWQKLGRNSPFLPPKAEFHHFCHRVSDEEFRQAYSAQLPRPQ